MVVFLHGCNQTPEQFAGGSRIAQVAEEKGWIVLLPKQDPARNPEGCWNWFLPINQLRGWGESEEIASYTREVASRYGVRRTVVAGLSAGGAMAATMAACYPDLYDGAAIHSGLGYRAAYDGASALWSIAHGSVILPELAGHLAYHCGQGWGSRMPLLSIQGSEDTRVDPVNQGQLTAGFEALNGLLGVSPKIPRVSRFKPKSGYPYSVTTTASTTEILVEGMAHAWSGGDPVFARTDPRGPDFTRLMFEFFEAQNQSREKSK